MNVVTEMSDLKPDNSESIATPAPGINTFGPEDNLSSLGQNQSSEPVNEEK